MPSHVSIQRLHSKVGISLAIRFRANSGQAPQPLHKGHPANLHTFKCWNYREPGSKQIASRSCGVGGGVVVRVNSGMFRPSITVKSPQNYAVGTDSNEVEFCPKSTGTYKIEVSSRHKGVGGPYSLEVIYLPSCQI